MAQPGTASIRVLLAVVVAGSLVTGCSGEPDPATSPTSIAAGVTITSSSSTTTQPPAVVPGSSWETVAPLDAGLGSEELDALGAYAEKQASNCTAVIRGGRLVASWYWNGFDVSSDQEIFSASKSVTAALVGIAEADGALTLEQPASELLTEWQGTESESITIRNLLSNDSGRYWDFQTDYGALLAAPDKTAQALALTQQHPPGTHWEYNNSAIQTLEAVVERATGTDMAEFAQERLFEPIGITASYARDAAGSPLAFMGVRAGCEDMARFGLLHLRDGVWGDERILPEGWVDEATSASQELNDSYGYLWWRNGDRRRTAVPSGAAVGDRDEGGAEAGEAARSWPDAPDDAYAALGFGNQIVLVMPERDLVVVRIGGSAGIASDGRIVNELARLVVAADDAAPDPRT